MAAAVLARACERALAYPFAPPRTSFVFDGGRAAPERAVHEHMPEFAALLARALETPRVAVIACGSNASPARLAEKFIPPRLNRPALVPTLRVTLSDYLVAHSAKFCSYAAMPATLHPWPGARARVHVSLLDAEELAAMDATEALGDEYERTGFPAAVIAGLPRGVDRVQVYTSRAGALSLERGTPGRPAASAAAEQTAPGLELLDQRQAVARAMIMLGELGGGEAGGVEDFLDRIAADEPARRAANARLRDWSLPFA